MISSKSHLVTNVDVMSPMWNSVCRDDVLTQKKAITALLSHFQLRIPVEKVLPCGHPAVNEFPPHHPLQYPFPTSPSPSPHNSTLHMPPCSLEDAGHCYQFDITFVFAEWCLSIIWFVQAIIQLVFLYKFTENAFHICFIFSDSLHDWVSFFNINIHDYRCDGQKCIEALVKHASQWDLSMYEWSRICSRSETRKN